MKVFEVDDCSERCWIVAQDESQAKELSIQEFYGEDTLDDDEELYIEMLDDDKSLTIYCEETDTTETKTAAEWALENENNPGLLASTLV